MSVYGRFGTGLQVNGAISPVGDVDQYRVALIQGLTYTFTAYGASTGTGTLVDPEMNLANLAGTSLAYNDDMAANNRNAQFTYTATQTNDYLVNVGEKGNNATGTYTLSITPGYASNYNDRVTGTAYGDAIAGMKGNDLIAGAAGNDYIYGQDGNDSLQGGYGHDLLSGGTGNDILRGMAHNDTLIGGAGSDQLIGGTGNDRFVFTDATDSLTSSPDKIVAYDGAIAFEGAGVAGGDVIDLSQIDANPYQAGNQAFVFSAQMGVGTVQLYNDANGDTVLVGSTDADAAPEFMIRIQDGSSLTAVGYSMDDFVL